VYIAYDLAAEKITLAMQRSPSVISLPKGSNLTNQFSNNMPSAYVLDLGMMQETVLLSGVFNDEPYVAGTTPARLAQVQQLVRTHWSTVRPGSIGSSIGVKGGIRIVIDVGQGQNVALTPNGSSQTDWGQFQYYQGVVSSFSADRDGGNLRWNWRMIMNVVNWPVTGGGAPMGRL